MVMLIMIRVEVLSAWGLPRSDFASLLPPQPYCLVRSFSKLSPDHCHSFYPPPTPQPSAYSSSCHQNPTQPAQSMPIPSQSRPIPIPIPITTTTNTFSFVETFQRRLIFSFHIHQLWKAKFFFKIFYATLLNLK